LGHHVFREALDRERRRAERFLESFVLVLVRCDQPPSEISQMSMWEPVIDALSQVQRSTDVLGWLHRGRTLGLIVPEIGAADLSFTGDVESRVESAFDAVDPDVRGRLSVRLYRHSATAPETANPTQAAEIPALLHSPERARRAAFKRGLDLVGSAVLLILLAPLLAIIAAAIKTRSRGPVLFTQVRVGQFGRPFTMLKFRTMQVENDASIHQAFVSQFIKAGTPQGGDGSAGVPFKLARDPRVTSIGRFLRTTSLDELPQLWNVFRGDMSLVGPRPPLQYEVEEYRPWHYRRVLEAKPGMTGLWQVTGRSRTTFDDMVRLDLRYAKEASVWSDIKILLATPRAVVSGKGAS
jgi:lipopolysaccharide/colanic/teichoic acid biosynthesis glycosyltransferase